MGVNIPSIDTEVARLSGGQRQAIAVARAVYSDAKMLLLDEPLAAMGAKEGALILDLIQRLKDERGIPMILIVHNYAQVFDVCDRVNLLKKRPYRVRQAGRRELRRRTHRTRRLRVPQSPRDG